MHRRRAGTEQVQIWYLWILPIHRNLAELGPGISGDYQSFVIARGNVLNNHNRENSGNCTLAAVRSNHRAQRRFRVPLPRTTDGQTNPKKEPRWYSITGQSVAVVYRGHQPSRRVSAVLRNRRRVAYRSCAYNISGMEFVRNALYRTRSDTTNRAAAQSRLGLVPKRTIVQTALGTTHREIRCG